MSSVEPAELLTWRAAIGRQEQRSEVLAADALHRFALVVGCEPDTDAANVPLAHWAFFLPCPPDNNIGTDGHPRRGGFLPAITLPRRMFAGSRIEFAAPLDIGQPAELLSTITDVKHKIGGTGDLVFVEVQRVLRQAGEPRVRESRSYVYRKEGAAVALPKAAKAAPEGQQWIPDEVTLFRFSAATFNGHRIHYDLPYAREVEGYPALVVHGPFTAAKLAGLATRAGPLAAFDFRALAPLFLGQPIYLRRAGQGKVEAVRCDGVVAMRAEFTLA